MLKNKSYFKSSKGNDAAKPTQKKGILTSKVNGKAYFQSWSMNVKIEKKSVCRHLDMMTCNHGSFPGNTPPWMFRDSTAGVPIKECEQDVKRIKDNCEDK